MKKIKSILIGFWLLISGDSRGTERRHVCFLCKSRKNWRCGECGCVIAMKTRSPDEKCPLGNW